LAIFYYCPFSPKPTGGNKQIHRHVSALHAAGFDAYVLVEDAKGSSWFQTTAPVAVLKHSVLQHAVRAVRRRPNPLSWLQNAKAPVLTVQREGKAADLQVGPEDVIVMPEFYGKRLHMPAFGVRLVIFNQNAHYTYLGFSATDELVGFPYLDSNLLGVLAVSEHIAEYLRFAFPKLDLKLTPNGVDTALFAPAAVKRRQIAYMPRKLSRDLVQVLQLLRGRGSLEGWSLVAIDNMPETQVAKVMSESAFFLSACESEGFGLPPLEAAACACTVVGYTGYAAREFMLPQYCYPIDQGDVLTFAVRLEQLLADYSRHPGKLQRQAMDHAAFVRRRYSANREAADVVAAWSRWVGPPQHAG
jgi:glycosyltransferase involved in cell wall biosynthesis